MPLRDGLSQHIVWGCIKAGWFTRWYSQNSKKTTSTRTVLPVDRLFERFLILQKLLEWERAAGQRSNTYTDCVLLHIITNDLTPFFRSVSVLVFLHTGESCSGKQEVNWNVSNIHLICLLSDLQQLLETFHPHKHFVHDRDVKPAPLTGRRPRVANIQSVSTSHAPFLLPDMRSTLPPCSFSIVCLHLTDGLIKLGLSVCTVGASHRSQLRAKTSVCNGSY